MNVVQSVQYSRHRVSSTPTAEAALRHRKLASRYRHRSVSHPKAPKRVSAAEHKIELLNCIRSLTFYRQTSPAPGSRSDHPPRESEHLDHDGQTYLYLRDPVLILESQQKNIDKVM